MLKVFHASSAAMVFCGVAASAQTALPLNTPTDVDGVTAVCTGIGSDQADNPDWKAYPLKIVVAGKDGQYLADAAVSISAKGKLRTTLRCETPWILVKLIPGRYQLSANRAGQIVTATAVVPAHGQRQITLRYPKAGGEVSPEHTP